jgi:hypothetical protein
MVKKVLTFIVLIFATALLFSTITITSPNGGEVWNPGAYHHVYWTSSGVTGDVSIKLYRFTGIMNLEATITNSIDVTTGNCSWLVPLNLTPSSNYVVRITSLSNPDDYDSSNDFFTINPVPTITVTSPNGGEIWTVGSTYQITWDTTNLFGYINLRLLIGTYGNYLNIGSANAIAGTYDWTIPATVNPVGSNFRIRLYSVLQPAIADTSDNFFTINPGPAVTITSPNGGESWRRGSTYPITWAATNLTGNAKLELFRGTATTPTATIVASTIITNGVQMWNIPTTIPEADDYKVKISSLVNTAVYDYSNDYFTISDVVENEDPGFVPIITALGGVYPNPFHAFTTIEYSVKAAGDVKIAVYDVRGRLVKQLLQTRSPQGSYTLSWDGTDNSGKQLSNGIYYLSMHTDAYHTSRKMLLLR